MKKYHFEFEPSPKDSRNNMTAEAHTLNSALIALNKKGFAGRVIREAWHTGASTSSGSISLRELIGREVPAIDKKTKKVVPDIQEFPFAEEVDQQCNKQKGQTHE